MSLSYISCFEPVTDSVVRLFKVFLEAFPELDNKANHRHLHEVILLFETRLTIDSFFFLPLSNQPIGVHRTNSR